jgi:hypothetical protein
MPWVTNPEFDMEHLEHLWNQGRTDAARRYERRNPQSLWYNTCSCNCGERVDEPHVLRNTSTENTRDHWLQGHAIRHRHSLIARATRNDEEARDELLLRGWKIPPELKPLPRFGHETEFFGISMSHAVRTLQRAGLEADEDGYHHEPRSYWRITSDGSVSNEGLELVSPILYTDSPDHRADMVRAISALRDAGAMVDATCGLHVHHSAIGLKPAELGNIVAHYVAFQPVITSMMHPARQDNEYTSDMRRYREWYERITSHRDYRHLKAEADGFSRYSSVNVCAIAAHDTLEFRQHAGTLDPKRTEEWVDFSKLFMDLPKRTNLESLFMVFDDPTQASVADMCRYLGASGSLTEAMEGRADYYGDPSQWSAEDIALQGTNDEHESEGCDHCESGLCDGSTCCNCGGRIYYEDD